MTADVDRSALTTKEVVREVLWGSIRSIVDPEGALSALPDICADLISSGEELEPALVELLEDDPLIGVLAARVLLELVNENKGWQNRRIVKRCQEFLNNALRQGERETRMWTCLMLQFQTPKCTIASLKALQLDSDTNLKVLAAAALAETKGCDSTTMSILREALTGENEVLATTSATALARIGTWSDEAVALIVDALRNRRPLRPMPILEGLKHVGVTARGAAQAVAGLINDEALTWAERQSAAVALGSITKGSAEGLRPLEEALFSPNWQIVAGAAMGLSISGQVTERAVTRLTFLAGSTDANLRRAAYEGLCGLGERAATAAPVLAERIGHEPESSMLEEVVRALVAIGIEAAPPLMEIVRVGDIRKVPAAITALTAIASMQPADVLRLLLLDSNARIRATAAQVVADLGDYAAPALPTLTSMLNEAADDELASFIIVVIAGCGPVNDATAAVVVGAMMRWVEIPIEWADRWLRYMGPKVGSAIEDALGRAQGAEKHRLEMLGKSIGTSETGDFQEFAGIDLMLVETFVCVGDILKENGPTSWPEMLNLLQKGPPRGSITALDFDIDPRTLSSYVKELGAALQRELTDRAPRQKGGLTKDGLQILERAKAYLQALKKRRGPTDRKA